MRERITFGPFTLIADQRLLLRHDAPVDLGARAFDILAVLASRPHEVIGKKELMASVWPDVTVDEGSLRFHIANLRKAIGDGTDGARYISTITGRGYCLVGTIARSVAQVDLDHRDTRYYPQAALPSRLTGLLGRAEDTKAITERLQSTRFVTLCGMGGVGKTTVAVDVAHDLLGTFDGAAYFVDLGALDESELVATTVASMLGLSLEPRDGISGLLAYLSPRRVLLILDTCEHLISAAAELAARIFAAAPQVHILATSREPLGITGEHVYRLPPLACPPGELELTADLVQQFSATRLFIERAAANGAQTDFQNEHAAIVADICRRLDGVPLAIELAAGRVASYGLQKTAALLNESLPLSWPGQRMAPGRQKTLQATLDWSYQLLSEIERLLLRRLAILVGSFPIEAALAVATDAAIEANIVFQAIDSLVAKSMIATRPEGATMLYRLLDTTRIYALNLDATDEERVDLTFRHANYCLTWLAERGGAWRRLNSATERSLHLAGLANVRAALSWCFGPEGDTSVGIKLAVAASPVFLSMSLLTECHRRAAQAIDALHESERGGSEEMRLQSALGVSMMFTRGGHDAAGKALNRSLFLAEKVGDRVDRLQILGPLQMFHLRTASFTKALHYAERCAELASELQDPVSVTLAHSLMGISLHLNGELGRATDALEAALQYGSPTTRSTTNYLGFDGRILAGAILARTLWLQGYTEHAIDRAYLTIEDAEALDHPLTLSIALVWVASLLLWAGDLEAAEEHIDQLISQAEVHSLGPYMAIGLGFRGELKIRHGDPSNGIKALNDSLGELHAAPYELLSTPLNIALIQGLTATRRFAEAHSLTDRTIHSVEENGDACYLPELLRLKGSLCRLVPRAGMELPEAYYVQAIALSRAQGARCWELRASIDLAELLIEQGADQRARGLLLPICEAFQSNPPSIDMMAAAALLARTDGKQPTGNWSSPR